MQGGLSFQWKIEFKASPGQYQIYLANITWDFILESLTVAETLTKRISTSNFNHSVSKNWASLSIIKYQQCHATIFCSLWIGVIITIGMSTITDQVEQLILQKLSKKLWPYDQAVHMSNHEPDIHMHLWVPQFISSQLLFPAHHFKRLLCFVSWSKYILPSFPTLHYK